MFKRDKTISYEYCIEGVTNMDTFTLQCRTLRERLPDLIVEDLILSDDDSPMQFFMYRDMEITVLYDIELQEVYVACPFDIAEYIVDLQG